MTDKHLLPTTSPADGAGHEAHPSRAFVSRRAWVVLAALGFLAVCGRIRPLLPLIVVCTYFMLLHMVTWSERRYSEPLHPLRAIIVAAAGKEVCDWLTGSPRLERRSVA